MAIKHLAVIESAAIEFEHAFNVLTGETGAGKSMLVEAVGLLLGGRASADLVRTGEDTASVEAQFVSETGEEVVVRREVTAQGRSRAFVNGELVNAALLRARVGALVELHGQHEHQALLDPATHLPMLDDWLEAGSEALAVAEHFAAVNAAASALSRAELDEGERASRLELLEFQLSELRRAAATAGEDETLERTRAVLRHAGRLQTLCAEAYGLLYDDEHAAMSTLALVWKRLGELADIDPHFAPHLSSREGIKAQLDDLALTLRDYGEGLDASPARLQEVEDRLALLERLKRKHGPTLDDVIGRQSRLESECAALVSGPGQQDAARRALEAARSGFLSRARALSVRRREGAGRLARAVEGALSDLGMTQVTFDVRLAVDETPAAWHSGGIDRGEFFLAANPGEELRQLARIASGGELSRIMLAFKTLAAGERPTRTLVFDEVDAGIGGRAATVVGERLRALGERTQVLCITHLPQIAALASAHFAIDKAVQGRRTQTSVTKLGGEAREQEIARMMAGEQALSGDVRLAARALLQAGAKVAPTAKAKGETARGAKAKVRK